MPGEIPKLERVAKRLIDTGATYVAVNEQSLVDGPAQLYYHLPVGVDDSQKEALYTFLDEDVGHRPETGRPGRVQIGDEPTPAYVHHALHGDLHLYRRVPVYVAESVPGLSPTDLDEGLTDVRAVATGAVEPEPQTTETVPLDELVERLADAGAGSVELAHDFLVREQPLIQLRVPMVPAVGKPIVGPVEAVDIEGETYPLRVTLTMSGPYGSGGTWTALYVSDTVAGLEPVSVEAGLQSGRELLARAANAESLRELEPESVP